MVSTQSCSKNLHSFWYRTNPQIYSLCGILEVLESLPPLAAQRCKVAKAALDKVLIAGIGVVEGIVVVFEDTGKVVVAADKRVAEDTAEVMVAADTAAEAVEDKMVAGDTAAEAVGDKMVAGDTVKEAVVADKTVAEDIVESVAVADTGEVAEGILA